MDDQIAKPLVSVIIPVYNGVKYLRDAIESVISQTYKPIEIIVVDDGSQDATGEIIKSYQPQIIGLQKFNGGVASALNLGILHATGELIAWLSHDDIFYPRKIEEQVNYMVLHPEVGVCYTDFEIIDAQKNYVSTVHTLWWPRPEMARRFLGNMYINGSTTMIRKVCFDRAGLFDEGLSHTQDLEMWLRMAQFFEFGYLASILLQSRSHPDQGSWNFVKQLDEERATFTNLFQRLGSGTFFPELKAILEPNKQKALSFQLFGDELLAQRRWYRFAIEQYETAQRIYPMTQTRIRLIRARLCIWALGDEKESTFLVKRARMILSQGDRKQARMLAARMMVKRPLRLDAWILWVSSLIPSSIIQFAKLTKRQLLRFRHST